MHIEICCFAMAWERLVGSKRQIHLQTQRFGHASHRSVQTSPYYSIRPCAHKISSTLPKSSSDITEDEAAFIWQYCPSHEDIFCYHLQFSVFAPDAFPKIFNYPSTQWVKNSQWNSGNVEFDNFCDLIEKFYWHFWTKYRTALAFLSTRIDVEIFKLSVRFWKSWHCKYTFRAPSVELKALSCETSE